MRFASPTAVVRSSRSGCKGFPRPCPCAPPSGFSPSRCLLSAKLPCGLVSCHNHARGSPYRGFPSRSAVTPSRTLVPSCRCQAWPAHPKMGASLTRLDFKAFSDQRVRELLAQMLLRTRLRSPLGIPILPRVLPPLAMMTASRHLLPWASVGCLQAGPQTCPPESLSTSGLADLSRDCRPVQGSTATDFPFG